MRAVDLLRRNIVGNTGDLPGPQIDHVLVVGRIVADAAGDVLLFQPANAVHQAGRAGHRPGAGKRLVACVRMEFVPVGSRARARYSTQIRSSSLTSGICHGSEPLAR